MQPICDEFFAEVEGASGTSSAVLNPPVRAYLDASRAYLLRLHDSGEAAQRVNEEHSDLTDRLIRKLFRLAEDRYFRDFPSLNFRFAVVAVGGYGRREMSLESDVDLLYLHRGKVNPYVETIAETINYRLWDAKLTVGSATRTIKECLRVGSEDLSTLTSYLDSRFLIGDPELYSEFESAVRERIRKRRVDFVRGKIEEQARRHESYHESLYLLQPNVRESVGGLRDYHTARWLARAVRWEVREAEDLHLHGFIDEAEARRLRAALEFIWRVRNELHRHGRKDDQLHYAAQQRLVAHLGYEAHENLLAVENLMREYYGHAREIDYICRQVVSQVQATVTRRRFGRRAPASYAVQEGFVIADNLLEIPSDELIRERPVRILSAFAVAQHHDVELSPRAQRVLRRSVELIDADFQRDPEAGTMFRTILGSSLRVYRTLQRMNELGVLGAYIPEFGGIVGLWQQDMYHTYTVDVHSLFLVEQLRRLRKGRHVDELPLATELMREVSGSDCVHLGCILHDIGKGRGGGHSEKGAKLVPDICTRLGMNERETEMVAFLVRHHLSMSAMAEQRDVNDPRQIMRLVSLAPTREALRNLYLVTVADIRSVSPVAWTKWKAGLLETFYRNAAEWLESGVEEGAAEEYFAKRAYQRFADTEKAVVDLLAAGGLDTQRVREFLESMPRRYLLSHAPLEIAEHVRAALAFLDTGEEVGVYSFVDPAEDQPFWGIVVMARDQPRLFSTVAGVLTAFRHDILAAQAYTTRDRLAVEIYIVRPLGGGAEEARLEARRIKQRLHAVLRGEREVGAVERGDPPTRAAREQPPSVQILNSESDLYTVIDVSTNDRPSLLYDITRTLADFELDVVMSRASTRAQRVIDAFYVRDRGQKLLDPERTKRLEEALLDAIRQETQ